MPKSPKPSNLARAPKPLLDDRRYKRLLRDVQHLVETANAAADHHKVNAQWKLGERIVKERLESRAGYHNSVLRDLSSEIGVAVRTLQYAIKFHQAYPTCPTDRLSWLHYRVLLESAAPADRARYQKLAVDEDLSSPALRRRILADQRPPEPGEPLLPRPIAHGYTYNVELLHVVDGDTLDLRIDAGFEMLRKGRFRLAAIDCPELPTAAGRRARDFVYKQLMHAKSIVVYTEVRPDIHGRYVAHVLYSHQDMDIDVCFRKGIHLNNQLLEHHHAELAPR